MSKQEALVSCPECGSRVRPCNLTRHRRDTRPRGRKSGRATRTSGRPRRPLRQFRTHDHRYDEHFPRGEGPFRFRIYRLRGGELQMIAAAETAGDCGQAHLRALPGRRVHRGRRDWSARHRSRSGRLDRSPLRPWAPTGGDMSERSHRAHGPRLRRGGPLLQPDRRALRRHAASASGNFWAPRARPGSRAVLEGRCASRSSELRTRVSWRAGRRWRRRPSVLGYASAESLRSAFYTTSACASFRRGRSRRTARSLATAAEEPRLLLRGVSSREPRAPESTPGPGAAEPRHLLRLHQLRVPLPALQRGPPRDRTGCRGPKRRRGRR